jgi:hypothetical protein
MTGAHAFAYAKGRVGPQSPNVTPSQPQYGMGSRQCIGGWHVPVLVHPAAKMHASPPPQSAVLRQLRDGMPESTFASLPPSPLGPGATDEEQPATRRTAMT